MKRLLDAWFAVGWHVVGIGVSILIMPFMLVWTLIMMVVNKVFR